jgi:hypothetical protein
VGVLRQILPELPELAFNSFPELLALAQLHTSKESRPAHPTSNLARVALVCSYSLNIQDVHFYVPDQTLRSYFHHMDWSYLE